MDRLLPLLRRKRVWIPLALFTAYTLFGFLVLPGILRTQIVKGIHDGMKREAKLDRVRFNPLILSLTLQGFELRDPDDTVFVAFDRLYMDVQLSSLVRLALTFREFRLDGPRIHVRLLPDGKPNFQDLIPTESGKPPRVVIGRFAVNHGALQVTNLLAARPEEATLAPIDLLLENFTTIPQKEGHYRIAAKDQGQGSWQWTGDLTFEPLHSSGVFEITDSRLRAFGEILKQRTGFEISDGRFGCRLQYAVDVHGDSLVARVDDSWLKLTQFSLREPSGSGDLLRFDSLAVSGIGLAYPEQTAAIRQVLLAGTRVRAWLQPDSTLNWLALLPAPEGTGTARGTASARDTTAVAPVAGATSSPVASAPPPEWRVTLKELAIRDLGVQFSDRTLDPPFEVSVSPVNVTLRDISNAPGARFALESDATIAEKGRLALSGSIGALPPAADLEVKLTDLPLPMFQPYLNPIAKLQVASGGLGVQGSLRFRDAKPVPDVAFKGRVESHNLLTRDRRDNERFLAWKAVEVNGIDASPAKVEIGGVKLTEPFAKIVIRRDRTTNVQEILGLPMPDSTATPPPPVSKKKQKRADAEAAKAAAPKPSEALEAMKSSAAPPIPVKVGRIEVVNGSADFADLSLILPFAARIEQLAGHVSQLSSSSSSRADVALDGKLQPSGNVHVGGGVDPWAQDTVLDLNVVFKDFSMPALTPYAGQFLGREIDKGRMSLDLGYRLTGRQLTGENKIVLDQLELGEKVESPEATKLPVGLAIAILKDKEGRIDLDVPVEGDLDDPEFRLGKVIWNFIMSLLKKIATAPFALLGRLIGGGGGDQELGQVIFEPGASTLAADQAESLDKLSKALTDRPQLNLEVRGSSDAALDGAAIRAAKFAALAAERMAADPKKYGTTLGYSPKLLEDLYLARFGKESLATLREAHTTTAGALPEKDPLHKAGSNRKVVNAPAMSTAIQDTLTSVQTADAADLLALANARAQAVQAKLIAQGIAESRVYLLDPAPAQIVDGRVRMELTLTD